MKIAAWQKSIHDHKKVSCVKIRNTGKYKHKLDLAEVGVTERSFIGGGKGKMD